MGSVDSVLKSIQDRMHSGNVDDELSALREEVGRQIVLIRQADDIKYAQVVFGGLLDIQTNVAKLMFKERMSEYINVPEWLWTFVRDFDRADDNRWQSYLYAKIKDGNYPFDE